MNRSVLTLVLSLLSVAGVSGQTKDVIEEVDAKLTQLRIATRHADERNEDVEILRRLLNKSLGLPDKASVRAELQLAPGGQGFGSLEHGQFVGDAKARTFASSPVGPFDGVYLAGRGVVYTLHIPAGVDLTYDPHTQQVGMNGGCSKCHQDTTVKLINHAVETSSNCTTCHTVGAVRPEAKTISEWERAKQDLRGEKPTPPESKKSDKPRGMMCEPGNLAEQIGIQLSTHARNLRHLGEKESITVVVTFDHLPGPPAGGVPAGKLGLTPDEVQALTLGDLHLKQKKYTEAVEAYLKGLVRFKDTVRLSAPANAPFKDVTTALEEMTASIRATYKSLAAAYLQLGHLDDAKAALEKATTFKVELAQGGATGTKPVGPAKLILSVMKTDIGAEAAAFKKSIRIDRMNFPEAEEKKVSK